MIQSTATKETSMLVKNNPRNLTASIPQIKFNYDTDTIKDMHRDKEPPHTSGFGEMLTGSLRKFQFAYNLFGKYCHILIHYSKMEHI